MINNTGGLFEKEQEGYDIREVATRYLSQWKVFLIFLFICVIAGIIYARYTIPKYMVTTKVLVRGADVSEKKSDDLIDAAFGSTKQLNLNNEILLFGSLSLMEKTVAKNNFNVSYFKKGNILTLDIYQEAPFRLTGVRISDSTKNYTFHLMRTTPTGGRFLYGLQPSKKSYPFMWSKPFAIDDQVFQFDSVVTYDRIGETPYIVTWQNTKKTAQHFASKLNIKPFDSKTSVIDLSMIAENVEKGKDVLDALYREFNVSDIDDRTKLSERTMNFIEERLDFVTNELRGVEVNLEDYQSSKQLVNVKSQSDQSLNNSSDVLKTIKSINIQQEVVSMIQNYFLNNAGENRLVPSSLGLDDATLAALITQYNNLKLKKEREAPLLAANSPIMQDIDMQLGSLKTSILESLNNISRTLLLQENNFQQQNNQFKSFLSSLPRNERVLQEIRRKQSITEGLYLYLLQKREEAAISRTEFNVANYKQIDPSSGFGPIDPNVRNIMIAAVLLGLFMAFCTVYIKELINDKVISVKDITSRVPVPVLGEIVQLTRGERKVMSAGDRSLISEQFRSIRTNISFHFRRNKKQVLLVTSSKPGEGKSFVSMSLAGILATPGKKVAFVEFDLRKPAVAANLHLHSPAGLADYLTGHSNALESIVHLHPDIPGLHIYPAGSIPSNPSDLLVTSDLGEMFAQLRQQYDYIVIDTPPAGLLKDALYLSQFSDLIIYVVRQRVTPKKQLNVIRDLKFHEELDNIGVLLNGVRLTRNGGYGDYKEYFGKQLKKKISSRQLVNGL